jgi:hypothetical protein
MLLMTNALADTELPVEVRQTLRAFFDAMATFMINHQAG